MAEYVFYPEASRGYTNIGWLDTRHAFNFAGVHDPQREPFGALVVLDEDTIQPGKGFGTHSHENMEIISIILEGRVRQVDSFGNEGFINHGEAQIISAGTGITHSEFNYYDNRRLKLLQIWIKPDRDDTDPKYAQMVIDEGMIGIKEILSPNGKDGSMRVHQQAWMYLARLPKGEAFSYNAIRHGNGVYVYVIDGQLNILKKHLVTGDAIGVTAAVSFDIEAESDALAVIIDIPVN
jgi:redox-sensitive bicupin YhaK (pirin superfamily)